MTFLMMEKRDYSYYNSILKGKHWPCAILDLDILEYNTHEILGEVESKKIRIASKSIRSIEVLKKIISIKPEAFSGIMAFTIDEAFFLAENGFKDILVGYPTMQLGNIKKVADFLKKGVQVTLMVDLVEHIEAINEIGKEQDVIFPICLDIDMSVQFPGIYFGVLRSSLNRKEALPPILSKLATSQYVKVIGLMGYEAQIAGVGDRKKGEIIVNSIVRLLKKKSIKKIAKRRHYFVNEIERFTGNSLKIVNAGGTGSINSSKNEEWVNEITVGSGFFSPSLFDYYKEFRYKPALFYAIEISRNPKDNVWTASGGGYIASGSVGKDKSPTPYLPMEIHLYKNEGVGEVQTPFKYKGDEKLKLGEPIFFRHAKAGELCERFNELIVLSNGEIVNHFRTYRGEGKSFL